MTISPEIEQLWVSRPGSIDKLAEHYLPLIMNVEEEYQGAAYLHLRRAIEMFDPAANHQGYAGFEGYAGYRIKMRINDEKTKEYEKAMHIAPSGAAKAERRRWREANRVYTETGIRPIDDFAVIASARISSFDLPVSGSETLTLGDTVGKEDDHSDLELLSLLTDEEQKLVEDMVAGTTLKDIADRKYGLGNYQNAALIKKDIEFLYDKIIWIYNGDERFKSLIEQVKKDKADGELRFRDIIISERRHDKNYRAEGIPSRSGRKTIHQIEGCPSRQKLVDCLARLSWTEMEEELGLGKKRLLTICKKYQLEYHLAARPSKIYSRKARKIIGEQTRRMARTNARIRRIRIAKGWSPELPPDPTIEQMKEHILSLGWDEMGEIFQFSGDYMRELAIRYGLLIDRPKTVRSKESNRKAKENLRKGIAKSTGATIPSKEQLAEDLPKMSWNQMVDKYGFSQQTLNNMAKEYGLQGLKNGRCSVRQISQKSDCSLVSETIKINQPDQKPDSKVKNKKHSHTWAVKKNWPSKERVEKIMSELPGVSAYRMAEMLGASRDSIRSILSYHNLTERYNQSRIRREPTKIELETAISKGWSLRKMREEFDISDKKKFRGILEKYSLYVPTKKKIQNDVSIEDSPCFYLKEQEEVELSGLFTEWATA